MNPEILTSLRSRSACEPALKYLSTHTDFKAAWDSCTHAEWLLWVLAEYDIPFDRAEYDRVREAAWDEYDRVNGAAWDEYERIREATWDEYERVNGATWDECDRIREVALAEYYRGRGAAWDEYERVTTEELRRQVSGADMEMWLLLIEGAH